ncbi:hypothetical protein TWF481_004855 [Arthrobotrys musiformis]|uniref:Uncharacterized protein n=1 Tax=Arthrobotrys musiformis TaxID=47236 RepID=A0AAV9WLV5_9PEZI
MTGLDYSLMTAYCGGKLYREWYVLTEGDVVCIDYPNDKLPEGLKEKAAKEAASESEKPFVPRPKAALPIKTPTEIVSAFQGDPQSVFGAQVQNPAPARQFGIGKTPAAEYHAGDPLQQLAVPSVPHGIKHWEKNFQNYQNLGGLTGEGTTTYPARPHLEAFAPRHQTRWSISKMDSTPLFSNSPMFTKNYRAIKTNPAIRVNFKFWTGQEVPLQLQPENRIRTIVKSLIAMMKGGNEGVTPERLIFKGPNPDQMITLEDPMSFLFPNQPAEVDVQVFLAEEEEEEALDVADVSMKEPDEFWAIGLGKEPFVPRFT